MFIRRAQNRRAGGRTHRLVSSERTADEPPSGAFRFEDDCHCTHRRRRMRWGFGRGFDVEENYPARGDMLAGQWLCTLRGGRMWRRASLLLVSGSTRKTRTDEKTRGAVLGLGGATEAWRGFAPDDSDQRGPSGFRNWTSGHWRELLLWHHEWSVRASSPHPRCSPESAALTMRSGRPGTCSMP